MNYVLPVDDDDVKILGIMARMEISAAEEFSEFLNNQFLAAGNPDWFQDVRHYRRSLGAPFNYDSPNDLRFVLNEATQHDSQIWHLIPNMDQMWVNAANNLRKKLNQLHHQQLRPDLHTLFQISSLFQQVTEGPGLEVAGWARALKSRVQSILAGTFEQPAAPSPEPAKPEAVTEIEREYELAKKEFEKRPPWGARWTGPKPQRELTLDRHTRDIYDSNGISVKHELGEIGDQVIGIWLRYFPRGGEVFVDDDGATMAYIKGIPTMVGWFGLPPEDTEVEVRGFALGHDYELLLDDIRHVSSGMLLSTAAKEDVSNLISSLAEKAAPGSILSITDYGDVFIPVLEGQPVRLAHAHKDVWFPTHLPGA